jgi:hypothetical protein
LVPPTFALAFPLPSRCAAIDCPGRVAHWRRRMCHTHRGMAMTTLRRRRLEDRQLRGLAPKPPQGDVAAGRQRAHYYRRPADQLRAEQRRQSCLAWRHEQQVAERTFRMHLYGIRFFDERTRTRPRPVFDRVRPRTPQTRPGVGSPRDVRALRAWVEHPTARRRLRLISACGLRRTAGTPRPVAASDAPRMLVPGRCGPGGQDRGVPLAPRVLAW